MRKLAAILGCLLLVGCANDLQGEVIEKNYDEGYMGSYPITVSCGNGCTSIQMQYYWVPDCYEIKIEGANSGSTCISVSEWESLEVGDDYEGPDVKPEDRKEKVD